MNNLRKSLKNYINKKYPDWDLTIALRYMPIVDDLKKRHQKEETILEMGSEITGITPYLKKKVTGVDIDFDYSKKNEWLTPIKIKGVELPFKDKSFDYVLSVDMLEHVPPQLRQKAVAEMIRVTRKKMYLTFPCGKESVKVDKHLNDYFVKKKGGQFQYLKEHLELGLPDAKEVEQQMRAESNCKVQVIGNTNITLWKWLLKMGIAGNKFESSLYRRLLLLLPLLKHFNYGTTYRKLFILEREK